MVLFDKKPPLISEFEGRRIERMLGKLFLGKLEANERIAVTGWREREWVCVRWELADMHRSFVYPVDCRIDAKRHRLPESDCKAIVLDFLGHFFGVFLDERQEPFTGPKWESVQFGDRELWIRGQVLDERAESEADALLRDAADEGGAGA